MEFRRYTINLEKLSDNILITPIGDIHVGNKGFNQEKFEKAINRIARGKNHYTIGIGDYIDNIPSGYGISDKRWASDTIEKKYLSPEEQTNYFVKQWKKVAHKSLGMLSGNHEWKYMSQDRFKKYFVYPTDEEGNQLYKEHYLGRLCLVLLVIKYKGKVIREFTILALHGGYAGMRTGGNINRLEDIVSSFEGVEIALVGHSHKLWTASLMVIGYDRYKNSLYERKIIMANTGTFLESNVKGVDSYIETSPRRAVKTGTITISLNAKDGDLYAHE